jgi:hypothetical protein
MHRTDPPWRRFCDRQKHAEIGAVNSGAGYGRDTWRHARPGVILKAMTSAMLVDGIRDADAARRRRLEARRILLSSQETIPCAFEI